MSAMVYGLLHIWICGIVLQLFTLYGHVISLFPNTLIEQSTWPEHTTTPRAVQTSTDEGACVMRTFPRNCSARQTLYEMTLRMNTHTIQMHNTHGHILTDRHTYLCIIALQSLHPSSWYSSIMDEQRAEIITSTNCNVTVSTQRQELLARVHANTSICHL